MPTTSVNVRIPDEILDIADKLASLRLRSRHYILVDALKSHFMPREADDVDAQVKEQLTRVAGKAISDNVMPPHSVNCACYRCKPPK